jgi:hypothetical protein
VLELSERIQTAWVRTAQYLWIGIKEDLFREHRQTRYALNPFNCPKHYLLTIHWLRRSALVAEIIAFIIVIPKAVLSLLQHRFFSLFLPGRRLLPYKQPFDIGELSE